MLSYAAMPLLLMPRCRRLMSPPLYAAYADAMPLMPLPRFCYAC